MHILKLSIECFFKTSILNCGYIFQEHLDSSLINGSLKFSFSCFTIYLGNAILFMSTNQIKSDFDS